MTQLFDKVDQLFVNGMVSGAIAIFIYFIVYVIIKRISNRFIDKQNWEQKFLIKKFKDILLLLIFTFLIVSQFTFTKDLASALLASGGIVAVVVGLASQEAAGNLVSGLMILASKPFKIGDTIIMKDNGLRGTVTDIRLNHTIIETLDKTLIMIPNTIMNKSIVENITLDTDFKIAYLTVEISYESDMQKAIQLMKDTVTSHPLFLDLSQNGEEKVIVHCMAFNESGIELRAKVSTRSAADSFQLLSDCRISLKEAFDKNNIEIPYPHVQVVK